MCIVYCVLCVCVVCYLLPVVLLLAGVIFVVCDVGVRCVVFGFCIALLLLRSRFCVVVLCVYYLCCYS